MADMKPEHVILDEDDCKRIVQADGNGNTGAKQQVDMVYRLLNAGKYSVIDYELMFRTPNTRIRSRRRGGTRISTTCGTGSIRSRFRRI